MSAVLWGGRTQGHQERVITPSTRGVNSCELPDSVLKYILWTAEPVTKFLSVKSRSSGPQGSSSLSLSPEVTTNHSSMPHSLKYKSQIAIQSLSRDEVVNVITVLKRAPRLYSEPLPQNQKVLQHLEWQGTLVHLDRVWHQSQLNT